MKKLLLLLIIPFLSFGQGWEQTFGDLGEDQGRSVQQTNDGGYVICGGTNSFGNGNIDVYLIKTDEIGWALVEIGAGRKKENDKLDYLAGIEFINKVGDEINKGDAIFRIFGSDAELLNNAKKSKISFY